jgi:hypothetical protein
MATSHHALHSLGSLLIKLLTGSVSDIPLSMTALTVIPHLDTVAGCPQPHGVVIVPYVQVHSVAQSQSKGPISRRYLTTAL